jgi:UDP-glucose 4-epimerase
MRSIREKYKRALVTGGAGFVGSHLVEELLEDGLEVVSLDDYSAGRRENLDHVRGNPKFIEVNHDITNPIGLAEHFKGVDLVFHEACSKNTVCLKNPPRDMEINGIGTLHVLTAARDAKVKKFVHASTGSVYGEPEIFPSDESHPLKPVSFYGVSKLAGDRYVRLFKHLYGMDVTILRYYHVFGERQDNSDVGGVVSIFGRRAFNNEPLIIYGDGSQIRSFTYVKDVVRINKFVALNDGTSGEEFNCASGIQVTIQELAERVLQYFGKQELGIQFKEWKPGDIKYFKVSNKKLTDLGFQFKTGFDEGIERTLSSVAEFLRKENVSR